MIFSFYTLGCKVNQYETQAMEQLLLAEGHTIAPWDEDCHGYIINTCSVTAVADKKNRAIIRRCRREHPDAIIADILKGITPDMGEYVVVSNRRSAIRYAMDIAKKDDIIVLAGKGHETYQEIQNVKYHLDEREEVAAYLAELR